MLDRLLFSAVVGLSVVAVAFGASRASAQPSKGSISGRVVMSKGGTPVPGARIFLFSNFSGFFSLPNGSIVQVGCDNTGIENPDKIKKINSGLIVLFSMNQKG